MGEKRALGRRVRVLRRRHEMTQKELAQRLGISPGYLNLIEHGKRPLSAELLIRVARVFDVDIACFAEDEADELARDVLDALSDPLFDGHELAPGEVRDLAEHHPSIARALLALYGAWVAARGGRGHDAAASGDLPLDHTPGEEVSDFLHRHGNYFGDIEESAERLWAEERLGSEDFFSGVCRALRRRFDVEVRIDHEGRLGGAVRRYEPSARTLWLSEVLPPRSRNFQAAHQLGLLLLEDAFGRYERDPGLTTPAARLMCRVALANYFAGALVMPYERFVDAAVELHYDVEMLGHRFRTSFEQVCHRLTTLRRPGREGVAFHFIRVDIAGNISKRFSGSGIPMARFSGACPRWNIYQAFLTPGLIRVQISQMPDGRAYFCIARTVSKGVGGYHAPHTIYAIGLGCRLEDATELVYARGIDLNNKEAYVPIGVTCRLCPRRDCAQRAFPSAAVPPPADALSRGPAFYAPASPSASTPARRASARAHSGKTLR